MGTCPWRTPVLGPLYGLGAWLIDMRTGRFEPMKRFLKASFRERLQIGRSDGAIEGRWIERFFESRSTSPKPPESSMS